MEGSGTRGNKSIISPRNMTRCRDGYSHASDRLAQKRQEKSRRDLKAGLPPISGYETSKGPSGTSRAGRLAEARSHKHTEGADSHPVLVGHGVQTRPRLMSIQLCSSPLTCQEGLRDRAPCHAPVTTERRERMPALRWGLGSAEVRREGGWSVASSLAGRS